MRDREKFGVRTLVLGAFLSIILSGCFDRPAEMLPETEERAYRRGLTLRKEGRNQEAMAAFLDVIDSRRVAPESHLEAGLLYLEHLGDPVSAIYHFNRYLYFKPNGENAPRVKELITTSKKEFMRSLPGDPFLDEVERLDAFARMKELDEENVRLRQQLATTRTELERWQNQGSRLAQRVEELQNLPPPTAQVAPIVVEHRQVVSRPASDARGPRTYTVQSGDTLSRISREMYGTTGRWTEIFEANRDQLPSQNALRPGQVLRIP